MSDGALYGGEFIESLSQNSHRISLADNTETSMRRPGKRRRLSQGKSIEDQIVLMRDLDLKGLRVRWHNEFGQPASDHLSRYLLFRILAYKIQADRLGDLDAEILKVLERSSANGNQKFASVSQRLAALDQRRIAPPPGTILVREWDRKSHHVMIMPDGYAWNGKTYDSLSKVAFAITGTKWNGPRFFGLRDKRYQSVLEARS